MTGTTKQKIIIGGLGLTLCVLSGASGLSYWSLIGVQPTVPLPNVILIVAMGNSFSLILLGWVYFLLWHAMSDAQKLEEAWQTSEDRLQVALKNSPTFVFNQDTELGYTRVYSTEFKQAEQALLEERNFVSAILDTASALIAVCDRQGRFIRINRACEQITDYSFEEIEGKYFWELFLIPEEVEAVQSIFQKLQAGQFPIEHDCYWVMRNGKRRLISWSNTVLLDADGSVKYIISIGIDISDRKRAEEIQQALEREQELSEIRLRFFSMASHEFRTPLSTILMSAQLLEASADEWSKEKRLRNLRRIISAAKDMTQLLDDILTINRAETGKIELNVKPIDLERFCQNLLEELQLPTNPRHTLNFFNHYANKTALLDERLLRSIFTNLLSNAIKYSPQGGEIHFILTSEREEVIFQVRDRGIGIPQSDQSHVFEAFHRGSNIGSLTGSGLGLTLVKKLVDLHGGKINLVSEVGIGTTFTVAIPSM